MYKLQSRKTQHGGIIVPRIAVLKYVATLIIIMSSCGLTPKMSAFSYHASWCRLPWADNRLLPKGFRPNHLLCQSAIDQRKYGRYTFLSLHVDVHSNPPRLTTWMMMYATAEAPHDTNWNNISFFNVYQHWDCWQPLKYNFFNPLPLELHHATQLKK